MTRSTKSRKPAKAKSKPAKAKREFIDEEELSPDDVDWEDRVQFELDPELIERIRSRRKLRQITLRVGEEQIAEARRVSAATGVPYQTILRRWLAQGASLSRSVRKAG